MRYAFGARLRHCFGHGALVNLIRARRRNQDFYERQARSSSLRVEKRFADGVHGDAVVRAIDGGKQRGDFDVATLTHDVKRPSAVFAAAPGEPSFWFASQLHCIMAQAESLCHRLCQNE